MSQLAGSPTCSEVTGGYNFVSRFGVWQIRGGCHHYIVSNPGGTVGGIRELFYGSVTHARIACEDLYGRLACANPVTLREYLAATHDDANTRRSLFFFFGPDPLPRKDDYPGRDRDMERIAAVRMMEGVAAARELSAWPPLLVNLSRQAITDTDALPVLIDAAIEMRRLSLETAARTCLSLVADVRASRASRVVA